MSQSQTSFPRWIPLLGGLLGSTTCGLLLYAFSVFIKPLMAEFGWGQTEVLLSYSIICLVFGLMTFPAGRLSDKFGPRNVVLIGGLIMSAGFFLVSTLSPPDPTLVAAVKETAAIAQEVAQNGTPEQVQAANEVAQMATDKLKEANRTSLYLLYVFYGLIAGFGGGCVYLPPIATAPKWWPDKRAMATGFTVVGLGLGSFVMGPLAGGMIESAGGSALPVFRYVGIAMAILVVISALCLKNPPAGYKPAGWNPPAPATPAGETTKAFRDYTYEEAKKTAQFWLLWIAYFCGSFAGLMVISVLAKLGADGMTNAGKMTPADVTKYAAYLPSALAISNAAVRVMIGPLADKIGTKKIFITLFALQVVAVLALFPASSTFVLAAVVAVVIGWNYGSMFTLFPATTLSYYGPSAQGSNYGLLFTAWGIAGFFGPFSGSMVQEWTGNWMYPCAISAVLLAIAVVILIVIKAPEKKTV